MDKVVSKYGIGYGEKSGTWNTYDNGKTWTFISDKIQEQASIGATTVSLNDDGVYCSIEGEAVKVLDLGYSSSSGGESGGGGGSGGSGETNNSKINNTKIRSVNGKFYVISDNIIYGSSDGKIWETETNGRFNGPIINGICYGTDGIYDLKNKKFYNNKKLYVYGNETYEEINNLTLYILNCIFLPSVSNSNGGSAFFTEGRYYLTDLKNTKFALDEENIYSYSDFSNLINWQEDVGMFPFEGLTFKDLAYSDTKKQGEETFTITQEKQIQKAIAHVNKFYNARKKELLENIAEDIKKIEPDEKYTETVKNAIYDSDVEKNNAFEMFRDYVMAAKGGSLEIYNKYLEATHYLDDFKAKSVIKAAIYETVKALAPDIRGRVHDLVAKAKQTGTKQEVIVSDIKWNYEEGLKTAYLKYQKYITRNVARFTEGGDKNIIRIAALYYRTELRQTYLDTVNKNLMGMTLLDDLLKHYSDRIKELDKFNNGEIQTLPSLELPEDFCEFYLDRFFLYLKNEVSKLKIIYFDEDPSYAELEDDEKKRAKAYLTEIVNMFKTRVSDYFVYMKKDFYFEPKGTIKTAYYNSLNGGAKPDWRTEFRKLDMEARDSIVYKFISKEEKI